MQFEAPIRLQDLCAKLQCAFEGNPDTLITGLNEIHVVGPQELTFVDHPKYYLKALKSPAAVVVIDQKPENAFGKDLIFAEDPFSLFLKLMEKQSTFQPSQKLISDSATIHPSAIIQPGAFVGNHVRIGADCIIHANVTIYDHTQIGDRVVIHANSTIGGDAFYVKRRQGFYEKFPSCGAVVIENDVEIGAGCTIDRGVTNLTVIGEGTRMDNQVHIGHDTIVGKHCLIAAQVGISGVVRLEDYVQIWGQVGVAKDLTIGKGAVILPKAGVIKSLPGGKSYLGAPAEETKTAMRQWIAIRKLPEIIRKFKI